MNQSMLTSLLSFFKVKLCFIFFNNKTKLLEKKNRMSCKALH